MRVQPVPGVSQATTVNSSASASIWLPHVERASPTTVKTPTTVDPADPQAGPGWFRRARMAPRCTTGLPAATSPPYEPNCVMWPQPAWPMSIESAAPTSAGSLMSATMRGLVGRQSVGVEQPTIAEDSAPPLWRRCRCRTSRSCFRTLATMSFACWTRWNGSTLMAAFGRATVIVCERRRRGWIATTSIRSRDAWLRASSHPRQGSHGRR